MPRNQVWLLVAVMTFLLAGAALLGELNAPDPRILDSRPSTLLSGPNGTRGLAEALTHLGIAVERRRRWFVGLDTLPPSRVPTLLVLLALPYGLIPSERDALMAARERGQPLFIAGGTLEGCFGFRPQFAPDSIFPGSWIDSRPVRSRFVLARDRPDRVSLRDCHTVWPTRVDTLVSTFDGLPVAAVLSFPRGGTVTLLADVHLLSNETLKTTRMGELIIPLFFRGGARLASFDEYHQGFSEGESLWGAAGGWLLTHPAGWALLQLVAAGLVALALAAVRVGPITALGESRRRSPLEHVDALASGLERARAVGVARQRLLNGLRRRLSGRGVRGIRRREPMEWLESSAAAAGSDTAARLETLLTIMRGANRGDVRSAALAVEDAWEAMLVRRAPRRF